MSTQIDFSDLVSRSRAFAIAALLLSIGLDNSCAAQLGDFKVQLIADDTKRDGPVVRKLHFQITNHVSRSSVELVCRHRVLGRGEWKLTFSSVNVRNQLQEQQVEAVAQLVAGATRVAEDMIAMNYSTNRVSTVELDEEGMPNFVIRSIYESLASQMKQTAGRAKPAYDRHLKGMLQAAFDENKVIMRIAKQLEEHGFSLTRAEPQELIAVRPELAGLSWQKIAKESAAGLKSGSATVVFYDLSLKGKK